MLSLIASFGEGRVTSLVIVHVVSEKTIVFRRPLSVVPSSDVGDIEEIKVDRYPSKMDEDSIALQLRLPAAEILLHVPKFPADVLEKIYQDPAN